MTIPLQFPARNRLVIAVTLFTVFLSLGACEDTDPRAAATVAQAPAPVNPPTAMPLDIAEREFALAQNRLGVNLPPVFSYSNTPMYADLMHQARRFGTPQMPWDEKAILGEDGWPVGDFGIFLMSSQRGLSTNGGRYTIRFHGQAMVQVVASPGILREPQYDPASGVTTIALDLQNHIDQLALSFTSSRTPIKDLRVIRPGYDAANPPLFTREFLDHIAPFKVVRLMDWLRTNNNPVSRWTMRATDTTTHYASEKGVPWEHAIELARVAGKDLWITIPGQADDNYVRSLASLLHDKLPAETRLYVEYSNEVWNSMFSQTRENLEAAVREAEKDPGSRLNYDGKNNKEIWKYRRIAQRGKEISDIFRSVFGDAEMMTRVRPVYAVQIVNTYSTELALDYMAKMHGPPNRYFYAIAGAPYFNMGPVQRSEDLGVDQILAALSDSIDAMTRISRIEKNQALANWYQLPFIAYEGGADTFGPGSLAAKKAASLDARMEGLCRRHLDNWYSNGGGLFMWFHAGAGKWDTPFGTWELTPDLAITDTPKIRCLRSVLAAEKTVLQGRNAVPGRIDALAYVGNEDPYAEASRDPLRYSHPGSHLDYLLKAPAAGIYQLTVHSSAKGKGNQIEASTSFGSVAGQIELSETGGDAVAESAPVEIRLREGFNTLRLRTAAVAAGFQLRHIEVRQAQNATRLPTYRPLTQ